MRYYLWILCLTPLIFSGCSGCSNSTQSSSKPVDYNLAGFVSAKSFKFASIRLLTVDAKGQRGVLTSSTISNQNGYFRLQLKKDSLGKAMVVLAKRGDKSQFSCELVSGCFDNVPYQGGLKLTDTFELSAVVGGALDNMIINTNWLTHLASAYAYTTYISNDDDLNTTHIPKAGVYSPYNIELANKQVSMLFGFGDIISMPITQPSNLEQVSGSSKQQKVDSIVAGAVLASMQALAKAKNQTIDVWLNKVVDDFLRNKGQLYQKGGINHASLFDIYQAAENLLVENRNHQQSLKKAVPAEVGDAINVLKQRRASLVDGKLTNVKASSSYTEFEDAMKSSKSFLKNLNEELINFYGQDPNKKSFVNADYAKAVISHYEGLKETYRVQLAQGVDADFLTLQNLIAYFASCIADTCDTSSSVHGSSSYDASKKTLAYLNSGNRFEMTYIVKPRKEGDATSQIFDFTTQGSLAKIKLEGEAYVRIRYDESIDKVRKIGESHNHIQPVGFEFVWPEISVPKVDGNIMKFSFSAKLLGVKDGLNANSKYHYNLTEISVYSNIAKDLIGSNEAVDANNYKNFTSIKFLAKSASGGSYYPESYWPKFSGFFDANNQEITHPSFDGIFSPNSGTGFTKGSIENGMFQYRQGNESINFAGKEQTVAYLDFWIKNQGANRTRIYADVGRSGFYGSQLCILTPPDGNNNGPLTADWSVKGESCGGITNVKAKKPSFADLYEKGAFKLFSINGRGVYEPQYGSFAPTTAVQTVNGKLTTPFIMGIENLKLQLEHKLTDKPNAVAKFDLTQRVQDVWEAAISFGYDYTNLIGVIPTGLKTKSLYLSYLVKRKLDNPDPVRIELGSLLIFNGRDAIVGKDSIAVQVASEVEFKEGNTKKACGLYQHGKLISKNDCSAIAYLTYRGALMATIREERPDVYVARYLDGSFIILGE